MCNTKYHECVWPSFETVRCEAHQPLRLLGPLVALTALGEGCGPFDKPVEAEADSTGHISEIQRIAQGGTLGQLLVEARLTKGDAEHLDK